MNATRHNNGTRTYRGRTLEEILPRIKSELGPDAVIVRQRDGLTGGVGGFFQRQCIEVDAHAPAPPERRFDAYDEGEAVLPASHEEEHEDEDEHTSAFLPDDPATIEGLSSPAIQEMLRQAAPFADQLTAAAERDEMDAAEGPSRAIGPAAYKPASPASASASASAPARPRPSAAGTVEGTLTSAGIAHDLAAALVTETVTHRLPFASPRALKRLVRDALASRIPVAPAAPGRGRSLAFVGPGGAGKTQCAARLAAAYASGSDVPVVVLSLRPADGGAELASLLEPHGVGVRAAGSAEEARAYIAGALSHALVVVDTPAVTPASAQEVGALADDLRTLGLDELHLAIPATFSSAAAEELLERLEPLGISRITLTHTDETSRIGALLDLVISRETPIAFTSTAGAIEPVDAAALAHAVLP